MPFHPNTSHPFSTHRFDVRHLSALPALSLNRLIGFAASGLLGMFFPIFLYEYFDMSLTAVFLWFGVVYLTRIPCDIFGAKIFSRTGLVPSMYMGTVCWVVFYLSSFALDVDFGIAPIWLHVLAILGLNGLAACYWAPFHVDFATFSKKGKRGRELSMLYAAQQIVGIIAPLAGGFIIMQYSYSAAFAMGILLILLSLAPLTLLPNVHVQYEFGFFETFKKLFQKPFRYMALAFIAHGAENLTATIAWSLFLFIVFDGAYLEVGAFASLIVVVTLALQLLLGKRLDKGRPGRWLICGTRVYSLGWIAKAFVGTVQGVFAASTFHSFGSILMQTPLDVLNYEKAADAGHYIDEYSVLRGLSMNIGRVLMILIILAILQVAPLQTSFILVAFVAFGVNWITRFSLKAN